MPFTAGMLARLTSLIETGSASTDWRGLSSQLTAHGLPGQIEVGDFVDSTSPAKDWLQALQRRCAAQQVTEQASRLSPLDTSQPHQLCLLVSPGRATQARLSEKCPDPPASVLQVSQKHACIQLLAVSCRLCSAGLFLEHQGAWLQLAQAQLQARAESELVQDALWTLVGACFSR